MAHRCTGEFPTACAVRNLEIKGLERDRFYAMQSSLYLRFADYQKKTKRIIPVIALTPEPAT